MVLYSYGESFGKPTTECKAGCVSVKRLANPPKALRKLNGLNKDLRRWVVENGATAVHEIVKDVEMHLNNFLKNHDTAILEATMALRRRLSADLTCFIVNLAFASEICIGIGCVKGQHRSVSIVEHIVRNQLLQLHSLRSYKVRAYHRELQQQQNRKKSEQGKWRDKNHR